MLVELGYDAVGARYLELVARTEGDPRASLGCGDTPGAVEESWLGAPMFFSSHPAAVNRELLSGAGFALLPDELVAMREDGVEAVFQWVLGRVGSAWLH